VDSDNKLIGLVTALGIGLMIGVIRERRHEPEFTKAGTRTHALVAITGLVSWGFGLEPFIVGLLIVGALAVSGYLKTAHKDPGLTGEVSLILTYILAALAQTNAPFAAAIAVLCAILLWAKPSLQRLSRELIKEQELKDGLLLAASALVVMPLLPSKAVDPWGILIPTTLWRIVVLVMTVGMLGHIALRAVGARWGLPIAGFFSGFASSTAAVGGLGHRAKKDPNLILPASAAALLSNLASLFLTMGVIGIASPKLLSTMMIPLLLAALGLFFTATLCLRKFNRHEGIINESEGRAFKVSHALLIATFIAATSLFSAWLSGFFGNAGVVVTAVLVALAEIHAAVASIGQMNATGNLDPQIANWSIVAILTSSALAKMTLAFISGGKRFGTLVTIGLLAMVIGAWLGVILG
jgi:uncharacterized membrane protein (DUF4010 family)